MAGAKACVGDALASAVMEKSAGPKDAAILAEYGRLAELARLARGNQIYHSAGRYLRNARTARLFDGIRLDALSRLVGMAGRGRGAVASVSGVVHDMLGTRPAVGAVARSAGGALVRRLPDVRPGALRHLDALGAVGRQGRRQADTALGSVVGVGPMAVPAYASASAAGVSRGTRMTDEQLKELARKIEKTVPKKRTAKADPLRPRSSDTSTPKPGGRRGTPGASRARQGSSTPSAPTHQSNVDKINELLEDLSSRTERYSEAARAMTGA